MMSNGFNNKLLEAMEQRINLINMLSINKKDYRVSDFIKESYLKFLQKPDFDLFMFKTARVVDEIREHYEKYGTDFQKKRLKE